MAKASIKIGCSNELSNNSPDQEHNNAKGGCDDGSTIYNNLPSPWSKYMPDNPTHQDEDPPPANLCLLKHLLNQNLPASSEKTFESASLASGMDPEELPTVSSCKEHSPYDSSEELVSLLLGKVGAKKSAE